MAVFTLDLHSHRNENNVKPEEYWERVLSLGINAIAITEHADKDSKTAFLALEEKRPLDIVLIPGSELNCEHGHLLAFGKSREFYELKELFEENVKLSRVLDIAKENGLLLSVSHPWGFNNDSFGYKLGFEKLEEILLQENLGVEIYNGMIGNIANFIFETGWVKKPVSFLDFLEKNRVARKTGLGMLGGKIKRKIDSERRELVERCAKAIELSQSASFVTAGSDAHSASRLGEGIMKINSEETKLSNKNVLDEIMKKNNVIWSGPLVVEKEPGVFERADKPFNRKELIQGMRYATGSFIKRARKKLSEKQAPKSQ